MGNMRCALRLAAVLAVVGLLGCGSKGIKGIPVSGNVTLDGQPVENGVIQFQPEGGKAAGASVSIEGGKYEVPAEAGLAAGNHKVAIKSQAPAVSSTDPAESMKQAQAAANFKDPIPEKYNTKTELEAKIADDSRAFNFELKSK